MGMGSFSWQLRELAPCRPFITNRRAGFWLLVAFPWEALEAIRKQSYLKAHSQSLVKWIQQMPSIS